MSTGFKFVDDDDEDTSGVPAKVQSPWEFSGYSRTVAEEHLERKTTSIDDKIARAKQRKELQLNRRAEREEELKKSRKAEQKKKKNADDSDEEEEEDDEDENDGESDDDGDDSEIDKGAVEADSDDDAGDVANEEDTEDSDVEDPDSENEDEKVKVKQEKKKEVKEIQKKPKTSAKFFSSAEGANFNAKSFLELHISRPLLRACEALGYKKPTPIQGACIPLALTGRDICGSAVTGSGKTAAFALPILERLLYRPRRIPAIRVLILTPTRELAVQVHSMIEKLAQFTDIRCCLVVGGLSCKVQEVALRSDPDIVIATPGRMIDHLHNTQSVGLEDLSILVLDEADRLLELGFSNEVHELVRLCPKKRQTMLFSATMTEEVNELVKLSLVNPVRLSADPSTQRPTTLIEQFVKIRPQHEGDKEAVLLALCTRSFTSQVIIFSGTKIEAHRLKILFGLSGLKAAELHGNLTQAQRLDALELFRNKDVDFLIATDVAARGLDIVGVETVINFECPKDITTYVHRVGRTARAGQRGCAITFACEKDRILIKAVAKRAGSKLSNRVVPVDIIMKWHNKICELENSVRAVIKEEREERALRKAEMEANKAQNLIDYESEIYSRPKKTWFQTPKEKRQVVNASKAVKVTGSGNSNNEDTQKAKESKKRALEKEKNMTRKKRRRLEASRESVEVDNEDDADDGDEGGYEKPKGAKGSKKGMSSTKQGAGTSVAELAYRRAKAVKAMDKARQAGKLRKPVGGFNAKKKVPREKNRRTEMEELFKGDMSKTKSKGGKPGRKPGLAKHSFKSKSRYKRR